MAGAVFLRLPRREPRLTGSGYPLLCRGKMSIPQAWMLSVAPVAPSVALREPCRLLDWAQWGPRRQLEGAVHWAAAVATGARSAGDFIVRRYSQCAVRLLHAHSTLHTW
jgi:hypothetical protein